MTAPATPADAALAAAAEPKDAGEDLELSQRVGVNLRRLRTQRGLSLEKLASVSGVSRAMLSQIELGRSAPTINLVWKIARALDLPFSTLIADAAAQPVRLLRKAQSKTLVSASGDFSSRALFPFGGDRQVEFYELRLAAAREERAEAHALGTTENLIAVRGRLEIEVGNDTFRLEPGDAILFEADVPHVYRNLGDSEAVLYLVMTYAGHPDHG